MTRLAVTGHRGLPDATAALIDAALRTVIGKHANSHLIGLSCLADGADALFAQAILDHGGALHAIVPAKKYRASLPPDYHPTYDTLLVQAAKVITLDHTESDSEAHMNASLHMIAEADALLAVWDGNPARGYGGTADVVHAAQTHNLPVTIIWPPGAQRD